MSGLEGYSPFDVGFAKWANYIELGLGVERGFMKIWKNGQLEVWGNEDDPNGEPGITFTPDDAELLRELANELESRAAEYAEWKREHEPDEQRSPQIIAGPAATPELNNFALK
jgi:hypothetical protein